MKRFLADHLYFLLTLPTSLFVLWNVPQVKQVWFQGPPAGVGAGIWLGYGVFVIWLMLYYGLSLFFVVPWRDADPVLRKKLLVRWHAGRPWWKWTWWALMRPVEWASEWLIALVRNVPP